MAIKEFYVDGVAGKKQVVKLVGKKVIGTILTRYPKNRTRGDIFETMEAAYSAKGNIIISYFTR